MADTNIGYWEKVLKNPTPAFRNLIDSEYTYIIKNIHADDIVLDIGCGDGRNIKTILNKTENVFGVDNDDIAVLDAKNNFFNFPNVKIIKGSATHLPFNDKSFDVVVFFDILQNLDSEKEKAMSEAGRVIKYDGKIMLCAYSDEAFDERVRMYNIINVPIDKKEGTKVFFDKSVGANISEQFSLKDIGNIAKRTDLIITDSEKVGNIAYLCTLKKKTI